MSSQTLPDRVLVHVLIILRFAVVIIFYSTPGIWQTPLFSDHFPVLVHLSGQKRYLPIPTVATQVTMARRHDPEGIDAFGDRLLDVDWSNF